MAPKRPRPTHKATPSAVQTRQKKTKKVVSTSALFAQIPKLKAGRGLKHVSTLEHASPLQRVTVLRQEQLRPQSRRRMAAVIPKKKGVDHPLLGEFSDTTTSYATDLLSSASSKLISTRDSLVKRIDTASPETLLNPSTKNLLTTLSTPLRPSPAITSLRTTVEREQKILASLRKQHTSLTSSIDTLVAEILRVPAQNGTGKGEEGDEERMRLHRVLVERTMEFAREISEVGAVEIGVMEGEVRAEGRRRARIVEFFAGLDGDGDGDGDGSGGDWEE